MKVRNQTSKYQKIPELKKLCLNMFNVQKKYFTKKKLTPKNSNNSI